MSYLYRNGEKTNFYPENLVKDDCSLDIEVQYEAQLLSFENKIVATEAFPSYPNSNSIKWCILRHKEKGVAKVNIKKIYLPRWD